jgi:SHS2 domain-containing protein
LLYLGESEGMGFDDFDISLRDNRLHAVARGAPIAAQNKEIKAVTFHNLAVYSSEAGVSTIIVFDV